MDLTQQKLSACLIAFGFLGASIMTMIKCPTCPPFLEYHRSLSPKLKQYYKKVVAERAKIYLQGFCLGLVLAFTSLYFTYGKLDLKVNICLFVVISMAVQYFYYQSTPKKFHMLPMLETEVQVNNWHKVYHFMKYKYLSGAVLGMVGYGLLGWALANFF